MGDEDPKDQADQERERGKDGGASRHRVFAPPHPQPDPPVGKTMGAVLCAMPWSALARPAAALGALAAHARRALPEVPIACASEYVPLAAALGFDLYDAVAEDCYDLGELLYMRALYPERESAVRERFSTWAAQAFAGREPGALVPGATSFGDVFAHAVRTLDTHLDDAARRIPAGTRLLGLTTCFGQLYANLALAK